MITLEGVLLGTFGLEGKPDAERGGPLMLSRLTPRGLEIGCCTGGGPSGRWTEAPRIPTDRRGGELLLSMPLSMTASLANTLLSFSSISGGLCPFQVSISSSSIGEIPLGNKPLPLPRPLWRQRQQQKTVAATIRTATTERTLLKMTISVLLLEIEVDILKIGCSRDVCQWW